MIFLLVVKLTYVDNRTTITFILRFSKTRGCLGGCVLGGGSCLATYLNRKRVVYMWQYKCMKDGISMQKDGTISVLKNIHLTTNLYT